MIPASVTEGVIKACQSDSYEKLELTVKDLIAEGHSGYQVLTQLHDMLVTADFLTDKQKSVVLERLAVSNFPISLTSLKKKVVFLIFHRFVDCYL